MQPVHTNIQASACVQSDHDHVKHHYKPQYRSNNWLPLLKTSLQFEEVFGIDQAVTHSLNSKLMIKGDSSEYKTKCRIKVKMEVYLSCKVSLCRKTILGIRKWWFRLHLLQYGSWVEKLHCIIWRVPHRTSLNYRATKILQEVNTE